ncbi:nuclear body protein SP140-like protein isoform X11 [Myotis daubentonii]|uniref:nuclear body protein SP140-like protein isoform X11 n=1 Tax=Myotis daubentonii TaxID=98922 RepID=UPI002873CD9D|nr:nuclear body protein SP140-like protein isoform X11 [Myotis daubentonii]
MASRGSELSTRMSAEDEDIENKSINDIALKYFKKYKVEISDAIRTTFPFLELLRDHEFITNEMYEDSQESFKKWCSVHLVIYNVLSELEKKFDMSLLGLLFSKTIMKNYPDLFRIYKIFYKAIPDIEFLLKIDGEKNEERPNDQLSLEQGTGGSSYQRLMWLGPDAWNYNDTAPPEPGLLELCHDTSEINATETDTTSDNEDALKSQQTNEQRAQESKTAGVECEAQARTDCNQASDVIVINSQDFEEFTDEDEPPKGSTSALKRKPESMDFRKSPTSGQIPCKTGAELLHQGNQNTSCSVNPVGVEKEKSVECEAQARTDCNQASDVIVIDSQDFAEFTDGDGPPEASTTALNREPESMDFRKSPTSGKILCKTRAELLHQGNQNTSCSVNPVDIKEEKPFLYSGVECEAQARTDCNEASDVIVIDSQDFAEFTDGDGPPEASTTALNREPESMDFRKSPTSGKILCKTGTMHLGKKSTLEKAERKKRSRKHKEENANFHSEILPVTCGKIEGMLYVKKFKQGTKRKCIRSQDGNWFNPKEFEEKAGYGTSKSHWKTRVCSNGKTLKCLMKKGRLPTPPVERDRSKKLRSSEVCKICYREGNLFCCITCLSFFHGDCHLPPVETERSPWRCTLCRVKECLGSQQSARESEVLARPMGPESQLKCEFLLLMFYCHSESNGFQNIQRDNYRIENFQCMADFLVMDEIKKKLSERRYLNVMEFMQDVRHIFLVHRASKKCNNFCWGIRQEEKFELNFKQVFAVQETEQEHTTKLN